MNYKLIELDNELGVSTKEESEKTSVAILHFTSLDCSENVVEDNNHWVNLLEAKNDFSDKFDLKIITYYFNSDNKRKDDEQIKNIKRKCNWNLEQVDSSSEDIKKIITSKLIKKSEELTCHRVFVLVKTKSGKLKEIRNTYESSYDTYDIKRFLQDILENPEILKESLILNFEKFIKILEKQKTPPFSR